MKTAATCLLAAAYLALAGLVLAAAPRYALRCDALPHDVWGFPCAEVRR